ncbi:MAG: hypothetical protein QG567_1135 [Campylobacterota bacterium]|nr:hypothetical protein [Campylobacterota bacterium]
MKSFLQNVSSLLFSKNSKEYLSKIDVLKAMRCKKLFWLEKNSPIQEEPTTTDILKKATKNEVKIKARELFENGYLIKKRTQKSAIKETKKALKENKEVIFDAVFEYEGIVTKIDILAKEDVGYSFYEIKSGSGIKDTYFDEASLNYYLLSNSISLNKVFIIYINNKYIHQEELDINELFIKKNITQIAKRRLSGIVEALSSLKEIKDMPKTNIGSWCNDSYECKYKFLCWKNIPSPSIFDLHKLPGNKKFEFYKNNIIKFEDIPSDFALKDEQKRQIEAELEDKDIIKKEEIKKFISKANYPLYFLDFETFQQAIPKFKNLRPYEQIPFQFSLHILKTQNSEPIHIEFLASEKNDPRAELAEKLIKSIGKDGTIVAYNQSFEKSVIKRLAEQFSEYESELTSLLDRFVDLMEPFEKGSYYTKKMKGSHSIKSVLPALVPELSYKLLNIKDGGEAMSEYSLLYFKKNSKDIKKIKTSLLEYCKLDTLGMVKIWKKLEDCVQNK